mmetsp:Transcript_112081/g.241670  ORF Transcript_112081/g.241670 Transcript_112081/m.241670 type:complete len:219 (-) Transcript_112081:272-928(-)
MSTHTHRCSNCHKTFKTKASLFSSTVGAELLSDASELSISELVHAAIVHVVHEVVEGVVTGLVGAGVKSFLGALVVGLGLSGGVLHHVTSEAFLASTLEGVVKTHPVTYLVGTSVTFIVVRGGSTGEGGVQDDNTVHLRGALVVLGEGGPAQESSADVGRVEVELVGAANTEGLLHVLLGAGAGGHGVPVVIGSDVLGGKHELPVSGGIGSVQDIHLG